MARAILASASVWDAGGVAAVPVDMNGMLLRGTTLKNSGRIAGLVVYTGPESRIQMNAAPPPRKRGAAAGGICTPSGRGVCQVSIR